MIEENVFIYYKGLTPALCGFSTRRYTWPDSIPPAEWRPPGGEVNELATGPDSQAMR